MLYFVVWAWNGFQMGPGTEYNFDVSQDGRKWQHSVFNLEMVIKSGSLKRE
jgi:hypothetical protein